MNELNAQFSVKAGKEYIALSGGFMGKDEVVREVTDADRLQFEAAYKAFKTPPPPPEDKDATIAALKAELAKKSKPAP